MLNINGSTDPSYRYKMHRIVGKVEGRGNGIKTVIVNAQQVAEELKRPVEQFTKYIALEFSVSCHFEADKAIITGKFETQDLQTHVFSYAKRFVLCPKCGNPETIQLLHGKGKQANVFLKCGACGAESEGDNAHKLKTLIVKDLSEKIENKKKEKAGKGEDDDDEKAVKGEGEEKEKKEKKEKQEKKEKKEKKSKDADDDGEKKKKKKKKERKVNDEGEKEARVVDDVPFKACVEKLLPLVADPLDEKKVVTAAVSTLGEAGLFKDDIVHLIWNLTVERSAKPASAIEKYAKLLSLALDEVAMDDGAALVLASVEEVLIGKEGETLDRAIKTVPLILKALFDQEILDETNIIKWYSGELIPKPSSASYGVTDENVANRAKLQSKPLIDWLLADSSDDDSDEESDDAPKRNNRGSDTDSNSDDDDE